MTETLLVRADTVEGWIRYFPGRAELDAPSMPFTKRGSTRFRSRREAERALAEIVEDGGHPADFRIEEDAEGRCMIVVLERDGGEVAGMLGA